MSYLLLLAYKNIVRYKRRTILTSLVLAFGIMIFVVFSGMLKGFDDKSFENQIQFETGDFRIRSMSYDADSPFDISNFITNYDETESILKTKPYVKAYTERMSFTAELDNGKVSTPVVVIAINPELEDSVFTTQSFITRGKLQQDGAVAGESLAHDMNLNLGDQVYITFRNYHGTIDSVELNVTGIINAPDPQVNNSTIYMSIFDAQRYLSTESVTEIVLKTRDYREFRKFEPDLDKSLKGLSVVNWQKLGEDFIGVTQAKSRTMGFLLFFVAIIAIIGIINTVLMSVFEKKREIGTLKAMGMTDQEIRRMFVYEGFIIGIIGNVMGILAGIIINYYLAIKGIDITAMLGTSNIDIGYKVMGVVKSGWDIDAMVRAIVMSLIVSIISAYYPANKTTKLQPAECLRTIQ